jgi:hypothetical protein
MSKFFNETRNAQQKINPVPATANVDIQELVGALKQNMESNGSAAAHAGEVDLTNLLQPLKESHDVASQVAAVRLENCRSIRLPRTEERSFLVSQYNPAMQAAVEAYRTLRTRLVKQQTRNGARSLVVSSSAQGEGKTLTVFNLALCYAKIENWPVLLSMPTCAPAACRIWQAIRSRPVWPRSWKKTALINPRSCAQTFQASTFSPPGKPLLHPQNCFPVLAGRSSSGGHLSHSAWYWLIRLRYSVSPISN